MRLLPVVAALTAFGCSPEVAAPPGPVASVTARFDPTASPPVVPTPTDLALMGGDGVHPVIPDLPTDSAAQRALNQYLRGLAGFPPSSTAVASFTGPLDPNSLKVQTATAAGAIVVVDATAGALIPAVTAKMQGNNLALTANGRWPSGHKIAVLLYGDEDPVALRGAGGEPVLASTTFFFLRSPSPLLQRCRDVTSAACACPAAAIADPNDTTCHSSAQGLSDAQARAAEPQRAQISAALSALQPLVGSHARTDLVLFWSFTITSEPIAEFDPASGAIPFPNDVLRSPTTGLVNLPVPTGSAQAPLYMALNTLDGFSTSAAITAPIDAPAGVTLDAATLIPNGTLFLQNADPTPGAEQPTFDAAPGPGQLIIQPRAALVPDQRTYVAVLTRNITAGGMMLTPAPTTALIVQDAPLFDGTHSTVTQLTDADAAALEKLRLGLAPVVAAIGARGLPPEGIAALWVFTTQSIQRPLAALDAWPTQAALGTDVTITVYPAADYASLNLPAAVQALVTNVRAVILGSFTTRLVYDPQTRMVAFARTPSSAAPTQPAADRFAVTAPTAVVNVPVRFWMTLPNAPTTNAPITMVQHGLGSWRGDVFSLGNDLAGGGRAAIGFDLDFHGSRSKCSQDKQCMGTCNQATGVCSQGFVPATYATACILAAFSKDTTADCTPAASGNGTLDPTNLFGGRAGGYQYVVDASQVVRLLSAAGANGLPAALTAAGLGDAIDPTKLAFLGQSLGAIDGTVFLATDPSVTQASVLNVGGGHLFELLADGAYASTIDGLLAALMITRGSPAYFQLVQTARWALDPVDPYSVARLVTRAPSFSYVTGTPNAAKLAIVQEAGMDATIPPKYEAALSGELGFPNGVDGANHAQGRRRDSTIVSTYFADAVHSTLLSVMPSAAMRTQAVTYVLSDGATLPTP